MTNKLPDDFGKDLTTDERNRLAECFKKKEFTDLFFQYMKEISEPGAKEEYDKMIAMAEEEARKKKEEETIKQVVHQNPPSKSKKNQPKPKQDTRNKRQKSDARETKDDNGCASGQGKKGGKPSQQKVQANKQKSEQKANNVTLPKYKIVHSSFFDMGDYTESKDTDLVRLPDQLKATFELPLISSVQEIDVDLEPKRVILTCPPGSDPLKTKSSNSSSSNNDLPDCIYYADVELPHPVIVDSCKASFDKSTRQLLLVFGVDKTEEEKKKKQLKEQLEKERKEMELKKDESDDEEEILSKDEDEKQNKIINEKPAEQSVSSTDSSNLQQKENEPFSLKKTDLSLSIGKQNTKDLPESSVEFTITIKPQTGTIDTKSVEIRPEDDGKAIRIDFLTENPSQTHSYILQTNKSSTSSPSNESSSSSSSSAASVQPTPSKISPSFDVTSIHPTITPIGLCIVVSTASKESEQMPTSGFLSSSGSLREMPTIHPPPLSPSAQAVFDRESQSSDDHFGEDVENGKNETSNSANDNEQLNQKNKEKTQSEEGKIKGKGGEEEEEIEIVTTKAAALDAKRDGQFSSFRQSVKNSSLLDLDDF
ncbi:putative PIH1 CS-like domain [Monocercomonoides exilis]|uniref:putative PIH1 CS-like domain n=1 Tax=Monocercomonoides exilis TaxID=2049356 RepID=UPI0035598905|nr:putative PIH1 CS-like domain [Monocercomonoides exilis]|eukprot:MONOS_4137.1-p1 / transcript=MONOS_4137.1 / gene=MONOS_4137 / organism=Monocercomonoides_exilis_PA203 / gene_product=unspecified product / transcript_product=unspecified product / location=Mono_scaffold00106:41101-42996(+) / protein_length=593 / sequence_SO=supercontig / SO=protein_coding / is_pseudo=false